MIDLFLWYKQKRDQQLKEKDDEASNEESYVTVDAVGFDDDMVFGSDFIEMELEAEGFNAVSPYKLTPIYSQILEELF